MRSLPAGIIFPVMDIAQQGIAGIAPGRRVYAVGDVHGRFDLLEKMLEMVIDDGEKLGGDDNILVFLGDYIDRGPDSRRVIEKLSMPPPAGFHVVCLKGNHEEMLLNFLDGGGGAAAWLGNGGRETLNSYGLDPGGIPLFASADEIEKTRCGLRACMPGSHIEFLASLDLFYEQGGYFFVHAGVNPAAAIDEQDEEDLIWIRRKFLKSRKDFGKIIVHGHSVTSRPTFAANRIGMDTGAWRTGVLSCLVLAGEERRVLST